MRIIHLGVNGQDAIQSWERPLNEFTCGLHLLARTKQEGVAIVPAQSRTFVAYCRKTSMVTLHAQIIVSMNIFPQLIHGHFVLNRDYFS
jgi:hypothetical protein